MSEQSYENHSRIVPGYHIVLAGIVFLTLIAAIYHLIDQWGGPTQFVTVLVIATNVALIMAGFYGRAFALRAQDRVILLEESLRSQRLSRRPLDPGLTVRQIIGLRFASDEEWEALARRAIDENLTEDDIKKAVTTWRADEYRV
jgi:hypothetical protein